MIKSQNEQSKKLRKQRLQIIYNVVISTLAFSSVALVVADLNGWIFLTNAPYKWIDTAILLFFTVDYVVRFIRSDDHRSFFLSNITDLLAIIPFSPLKVNAVALSLFLISLFSDLPYPECLKISAFYKITSWRRISERFQPTDQGHSANEWLYLYFIRKSCHDIISVCYNGLR